MLMTGKQLNEMVATKGWLLVKFLPFENLDGRGKNDFEYRYGVNVPLEPVDLNTAESCAPGGLYFTFVHDEMKTQRWVDKYAYHVTVPDDARVMYYEKEVKFKADQLVIEGPWEQELYQKYLVLNLRWPGTQTPEICLAAVQQNGSALMHVKEQTPEICVAAVQQYIDVFFCVREQTPEICLAAVQQDGWMLEFVKEQTPEICLAAVRQKGMSLKCVKEQTPEICLAAVQQNGWVLKFVEKQTPELCLAAVQQRGWTLENVKEQTPEICLAAVLQNGLALEYVKEQTPEICILAVLQNSRALRYVKEQTPEIIAAGAPPPDPRC